VRCVRCPLTIFQNDFLQIIDIFGVQVKRNFACSTCKTHRLYFDPYWSISIPIPVRENEEVVTLEECLKKFLTPEAEFYCGVCKVERNSIPCMTIEKLPAVLVIRLEQAVLDEPTWQPKKLNTPVKFPLVELDMAPFTNNNIPGNSYQYNLYGISQHVGETPDEGYYVSYCKHPFSNHWHCYDAYAE